MFCDVICFIIIIVIFENNLKMHYNNGVMNKDKDNVIYMGMYIVFFLVVPLFLQGRLEFFFFF